MNILITGTLGVGKSHYLVTRILEYIKQGREVYADLDEMEIPGAAPIPKGGWLACPEGSVVIYDEAQKIEDFLFVKGQTVSKNPLIYELADSRKRGYDIIFTTHQPASLHTMILGFVGEHYNVTRPNNRKESHIALWRKAQALPNSDAALNRAEDVFKVPFVDENFKYYKSTVQDTHKTRIPDYIKKLIYKAIFCAIVIACILFYSPMLSLFTNSVKTTFGHNKAEPIIESQSSGITNSKNPFDIKNSMQTKLEQAKQQNTPVQSNQLTSNYDPTKPYSVDYSTYQYQYSDAPHFAGCMATLTKCTCYDQQGASLDVDKAQCKAAIKHLPFNPFKQQNNEVNYDVWKDLAKQERILKANTTEELIAAMNDTASQATVPTIKAVIPTVK
jgi:zona occludens toxin